MKDKKATTTTKWICATALSTALVIATGFIPAIPTPMGRIYWVDGMVLIAAFLLDPLAAFIAGGVGSLIYDLIMSPSMMVPSLIIHGVQGAVASAFTYIFFSKKFEFLNALTGALIAGVFVIWGYLVYRWILNGALYAALNIPRNIIQEVIGITLAIVICYAAGLKKRLVKSRLIKEKQFCKFLPLFKKRTEKESFNDQQNSDEAVLTHIDKED